MTTPSLFLELDPAALRELASLVEHHSPKMKARRRLDDLGRDQLFHMLQRGDRPTIGWWRRQFERMGTNGG